MNKREVEGSKGDYRGGLRHPPMCSMFNDHDVRTMMNKKIGEKAEKRPEKPPLFSGGYIILILWQQLKDCENLEKCLFCVYFRVIFVPFFLLLFST